jgi:hypothetical protein
MMTLEEVLGKFVSFQLMVKDSRHVENIAHNNTSLPSHKSLHSRRQKRRRPLQARDFQLIPPSLIMRRWLSLSKASGKSSIKRRKGLQIPF